MIQLCRICCLMTEFTGLAPFAAAGPVECLVGPHPPITPQDSQMPPYGAASEETAL
jgi:hypothetical protein